MAMAVGSSMLLARPIAISSGSSACDKKEAVSAKEPDQEPEVDIVINNVVCSFNVRCHLNLREIALKGLNVEYRKENGVRPIF
jgi:transcription initiation factor TFIID TATA-box-binding protein